MKLIVGYRNREFEWYTYPIRFNIHKRPWMVAGLDKNRGGTFNPMEPYYVEDNFITTVSRVKPKPKKKGKQRMRDFV